MDSYELILRANYALHGTLQGAYPVTPPVDGARGMIVTLDGVDTQLTNEQMPDDAMGDNPLLAFIDNEICAVHQWNLVGPNQYQLFVLRGRFGTAIAAHDAGVDVFLVQRSSLPIVEHPKFQPGNTAEIIVAGGSDPSGLDPTDLTLTGAAMALPAPCNLAANGVHQNPLWNGAANITFTWSAPDPGGDLDDSLDVSYAALLTFLAADGITVLATATVPLTPASYTLTAAQILAMLPGHAVASFYFQVQFQTQLDWATITSPVTQLLVTYV